MSKLGQDPLAQGAAAELPTLGEGCLRRFDPDAMSAEHGTDFPDAKAAWQLYLAEQNQHSLAPADSEQPVASRVGSGEKI